MCLRRPTPRRNPGLMNAQYIKDFSFENPRAPQSLMPQATPPEIKLDIRVDAKIWRRTRSR